MDYIRGREYYESSQEWASWLRYPLKFHTIRCYRQGRLFQRCGRDALKYPAYVEWRGAEIVGVVRGLLEEALLRQGFRGRDIKLQIRNTTRLILMGRCITAFAVQISRVLDALSALRSALFFRQIEVNELVDTPCNRRINSSWAPSASIWWEGCIYNCRAHLLNILVAVVGLIVEVWELWMCWLDIEDANRFKDKTLQQYALYLAPIHIWEIRENVRFITDCPHTHETIALIERYMTEGKSG